MSMVATEVGKAAATKIGEKHEERKQQKKAVQRQQQSARAPQQSTGDGDGPSPSVRSPRRPTSSRSVAVGKSHFKTYKGSTGKRSTDLKLKGPSKLPNLTLGSGKTTSLIAEWLIGVVIIVWGAFDGTKKSSSQAAAHDFFWRFFGWCGIFFVLALMMRGKNSGKFAVMFGALLDVAIVISAYNAGSFTALGNLVAGAPVLTTEPNNNKPAKGGKKSNPSEPQSKSNPGGIPDPFTDPGGFFKHLIFNPPGFLKFFDPFAWHL